MPDDDTLRAFAGELGSTNRDHLLAAPDTRDAYLSTRRSAVRPVPAGQPVRHAAGPPAEALQGWTNFFLTHADRDLNAEQQEDLHEGQLHRLNREARGDRSSQPSPGQFRGHQPSHGQFHQPYAPVRDDYRQQNAPLSAREHQRPLDPILDDPNADPLEQAKALRFKGTYNSKGPRRAVSGGPSDCPFVPRNQNAPNQRAMSYNQSGAPYNSGSGTRGARGGRGGYGNSLNPHADMHDQRNMTPVDRMIAQGQRNVNANTPMRGNAHSVQPGQARHTQAPQLRTQPRVTPGSQAFTSGPQARLNETAPPQVQMSNGHGRRYNSPTGTMVDRSNSLKTTPTVRDTSPSIFGTGPRAAAPVGKLVSPEEFMAHIRKGNGLMASKYAPQPSKAEESKLPQADQGLNGSKAVVSDEKKEDMAKMEEPKLQEPKPKEELKPKESKPKESKPKESKPKEELKLKQKPKPEHEPKPKPMGLMASRYAAK